ncbi:hypothetical protein [Streptomyces camponoticapitis]|uniref:hypothetical protein n=1 Tax=Streptomyces camponoticapitis TaxID=1616125 RepID=UPI0016638F25|nr:hypothetical protein [Streptomyces camponoticapitis]
MYPEPNPYLNPHPQPSGVFGPPPPAYPPAPAPPAYPPAPAPGPAPVPAYGAVPPNVNPEFLVADRHSGIVIDETGVTFDFEGQSAEFPWSDIQSVHSKPGGGHRLMVAVVLPGGKFYECGVKARNRMTLEQWVRHLGYVLHVYLGRRDNRGPWSP